MLKRKDPVLLNDSWITGNEMGQVANQIKEQMRKATIEACMVSVL